MDVHADREAPHEADLSTEQPLLAPLTACTINSLTINLSSLSNHVARIMVHSTFFLGSLNECELAMLSGSVASESDETAQSAGCESSYSLSYARFRVESIFC